MAAARRERWTSLLILAGCAAGLLQSVHFAAEAALFPQMVLALTAVLAAIMLVRSFLREREAEAPLIDHPGRLAISLVLTGLYILGIDRLGFYTASLIYVPLTAVALGYRHLGVIAGTTAGFLVTMYLVFDLLFRRPLPPEFFEIGVLDLVPVLTAGA